jgi:small conductance mechanosensitive channel
MLQDIQDAFSQVMDKLENWLETIVIMLPNLVAALIIFALFHFINKGIGNLFARTIPRFSQNNTINKFLGSLISTIIFATGLFIILGVLQLDKTVTSLLAGIGIVGLAIGLAFKDVAANFMAGIYIAIKSPINEGDILEYENYYGQIKKVGLRAATMETFQGQDVVIPNRYLIDNPFTHYTVNGVRRIDLPVGISYGDDLEKVEKITLEAIRKIPYLLPGRPVDFYYSDFGESSINFTVRYWVRFKKQTDYLLAVSDGIKNVKKAYDLNDITITFPIRTLDFGIKGGQTLAEMLNGKPVHYGDEKS